MSNLYVRLFFCLILPISIHAQVQSNKYHWQVLYQKLIVLPRLKEQTMGCFFTQLTKSCLMGGSVKLAISAIKKIFTEENLNTDQQFIAYIISITSGIIYFSYFMSIVSDKSLKAQKKALKKIISHWPLHQESTPEKLHAPFNELYHAYLLHEKTVFDQLLEERFDIIINILKQNNRFESNNHTSQAIYVHPL